MEAKDKTMLSFLSFLSLIKYSLLWVHEEGLVVCVGGGGEGKGGQEETMAKRLA